MSISFNDFYTLIEKELLQEAEAGDASDAESYKYINKIMCKMYVNESMYELVHENTELFRKILKYTFPSAANYFSVPNNVYQLVAYKYGNYWLSATDSSSSEDTIIAVEENKLYNEEGWAEGDVLIYDAIVYPDIVTDDTDVLNWKDSQLRVLRLNVMMKAMARKGKSITEYMQYEYQQLLNNFRICKPTITRQKMLSFQGHSLGRT